MVNPTILVPAADVWDYFCDNEEALSLEPQIIASCPELGTEIVIYVDTYGLYCIEVSDDYAVLETARVSYPAQSETVVKKLYEKYLTEEFVRDYEDYLDDYSEESEFKIQQEMREEELTDATVAFLYAVLGEELVDEINPDKVESIKNKILECLAKCEGYDIYRPTILETENGIVQVEYPYTCMKKDSKE